MRGSAEHTDQGSPAATDAYHTEVERASWDPQALGIARPNKTGGVVIYETAEQPTRVMKDGAPTFGLFGAPGDFDTGLIGSDSPDTGSVTGTRRYGKGPKGHPKTNTPQARGAYCAIWRWAKPRLRTMANECKA